MAELYAQEATLEAYDEMLEALVMRHPNLMGQDLRSLAASLTNTAMMAGGLKAIKDELTDIDSRLMGLGG